MLSDLEHGITKLMGGNNTSENSQALEELRDHLIDMHSRVGLGLVRRHLVYEEQIAR